MLEMKRVTYQYENAPKVVLKGVSAKFEPNKLYVIMGKSGAGKSTLLSLLAGLDVCIKGQIVFDGKDISQINRDAYRAKNVGIVFQGYNLLTNASAIDNVALSMQISEKGIKNVRKRSFDCLQNLEIDKDKAKRKVLKLSGGEQQRVAIASAIAHEPQVLIADEPTGNLDDETERLIMEQLQRMAHENGKCVIIVTHSKEVANYADELWGLSKGNLNFIKDNQ